MSEVAHDEAKAMGLLRRCYHWTLSWADHPQAHWALFLIALIEASVFPIPPDVLLLALALGRPDLALRLGAITTAGSTVGAVIGFCIGMFLFASVAEPILAFYGMMDQLERMQQLFSDYGLWIVMIAGFSPIPFKVFTIAAGAFGMPFLVFMLGVVASRGGRFMLEGVLMRWGGVRLRGLVERHFNTLTVLVVVLVVAGFLGIWLWRHSG